MKQIINLKCLINEWMNEWEILLLQEEEANLLFTNIEDDNGFLLNQTYPVLDNAAKW